MAGWQSKANIQEEGQKQMVKMLNFRVQIFYVAIITVIICFGNLIAVAHYSHPEYAGPATKYNTSYQGIEAIVFNRRDWVHYAGNLFSILTSVPLLFVITPKVEINRQRRLILFPYAVCSALMVVAPEYIIFGNVKMDSSFVAINYGPLMDVTEARSEPNRNNHALKSGIIGFNDTIVSNRVNKDRESENIGYFDSNGSNTSLKDLKLNKTKSENTNANLNKKLTENKSTLSAIPRSIESNRKLNRERISCFVIYQLWIILRAVFFVIVCRYFYFLQWLATTHRPQPKRSNATRRGIIDIQVNGKAEYEHFLL
uniref:Uncharacterized protein n=1 Tax=Clytia hemisphaerica TaxID=252671 RepID=A0A7M5WJM0_9CNID